MPRRSARKYASAATSWRRTSGSMLVETAVVVCRDSKTEITELSVSSGAAVVALRLVVFLPIDSRFVTIKCLRVCVMLMHSHPASTRLYNAAAHTFVI